MYDWDQLRKTIAGGDVLLPGDDGYKESLKRWSATCEKPATVVVRPTNSVEVSAAVTFAVANSIPLTVCGGGHSSSGTSSSDGMVIDLSKMRTVDVNPTDMTVAFDGGCLWVDVDTALDRVGLATVGGVVNHTGVGGLVLGGGHGWLTAKHGLTIDCLVSVEVVLADGSIVEASDETNPDLFWAVRGAGAQFGVVTRFVSKAFKQEKVWSGLLAFSEDKLPQLIAVASEFHDRHSTEGHCLVFGIGYGLDGVTHGIMATPCFHGPEADGRRYFSKLLEVGAIHDHTQMMTIAQLNTLLNPVSEHGIRRLMGSSNITMPLDADALAESARLFWDFCDSHPGMGMSVIAIEFYPTDKIREVPLTAMAYANRGDYYDAMTVFGWSDPAHDAPVRTFNRSLCDQIRRTNGYQAVGDGPIGKYINIEGDEMSPRDAYGVNLGRLRKIKSKYDPGNVFYKWHGVGVE